ncbi:MAG: exodeoxyribonuclease VII small subunit [Peptoniphilaceae bacterium]|nr:exodeoxyribonuclease VII small subunit [Peptoniphilaceae bacterium]MDY6019392.1 exodeoxyribonuclease VII small subunit [Anaerococcus sp.]
MNETFEENYEKLKKLLEDLENTKDNLDQSFKIYSEAKELYQKLEKQLEDYKAKVDIISEEKSVD